MMDSETPEAKPDAEQDAGAAMGQPQDSAQRAKPGQKPNEAQPRKGIFSMQVPAYLAVLLLVLGLFGGYAAMVIMNQKADIPACPACPDSGQKVNVKLIYYSGSGMVEKWNSILDVFDGKGIDYVVEEIDAESDKGKLLVGEFAITSAPTALVEMRNLANYPEIKRVMDSASDFMMKNGYYIIPELNLNVNKHYNRIYLTQLDPDCSNEGRYEALYFDDPYNAFSIAQRPLTKKFLFEFGDYTRTKYQFARNNHFAKTEEIQGLVTLAGNYQLCAQQQSKYEQMNRQILGIFCNAGGGETELTDEELISCSKFSPHFGTPLDESELKRAASRVAGLEMGTFNECLASDFLLKKSSGRAAIYNISEVPSAVVGCTFNVAVLDIGIAVCDINPKLEACI